MSHPRGHHAQGGWENFGVNPQECKDTRMLQLLPDQGFPTKRLKLQVKWYPSSSHKINYSTYSVRVLILPNSQVFESNFLPLEPGTVYIGKPAARDRLVFQQSQSPDKDRGWNNLRSFGEFHEQPPSLAANLVRPQKPFG